MVRASDPSDHLVGMALVYLQWEIRIRQNCRDGIMILPSESFEFQGTQGDPVTRLRRRYKQPCAITGPNFSNCHFSKFVSQLDARPRFPLLSRQIPFHRKIARFCILTTDSSIMATLRASLSSPCTQRSVSSRNAERKSASLLSPRLLKSSRAD